MVTENDTYFQEMNTDTWLAPYLMWSVISEGINYSRKTSDTYLDSSLLAYETVTTQQVEESSVQTHSFQTDYEAIDRAAQSVFLLEVYNESNEAIATGSGFVAFDNATLITNEHVIEDAAYVMVMKEDERHFRVTVSVSVSQQFYGWVFGLGKSVRIVGPESVKEGMKKALADIAARYEN